MTEKVVLIELSSDLLLSKIKETYGYGFLPRSVGNVVRHNILTAAQEQLIDDLLSLMGVDPSGPLAGIGRDSFVMGGMPGLRQTVEAYNKSIE